MLSPNLEQTLRRALAYANERRHDYATLEHLLLALVDDQDAIAVMRRSLPRGIRLVAEIEPVPMPVICAVDGGCFGAAVALTLACDIVLAGDDAAFATTPARLGLSYPARDVARLEAG